MKRPSNETLAQIGSGSIKDFMIAYDIMGKVKTKFAGFERIWTYAHYIYIVFELEKSIMTKNQAFWKFFDWEFSN